MLSSVGGGLGLLLAVWGNRYLSAYLSLDMPINLRMVAFALAASMATGAAFGVAPAWFALRSDVNKGLKQEGRGTSVDRSRHRFRNGLIVAEITLALILLTGAGFFIRGIQRISNRELGWRPENLLVGTLSLSHGRFGEARDVRSANFAAQFKNDLQELPGVDQVAISQGSPAIGTHTTAFSIEGQPEPIAGHQPVANTDSITPGFLKTYGMRLLRGRDFTDGDRGDTRLVAIINESMAKRFWPGQDPIGKRIHEDVPTQNDLGWTEIVGVTNDIAIGGDLTKAPAYTFYRPFAQNSNRFLVFTLHSRSDPRLLKDGVRRIFAKTEPDMVISLMATAEEINSWALSTFTFIRRMLVVIAAFGLLLSSVGIYGVTANLASERTREIGIRVALGAQPIDITSLFLRNGMRISFLGTAIGLLGSLALVKILVRKLAMLPGGDPLVFVTVCAILVGVSLTACWLPARRAAKADPLVALRAD
jgi:putative ABC transport system permease protein